MTSVLDSSVWVALFLDFDTQHKKAAYLFAGLTGAIYLPYCVISEVVTVLAYKHSKEQADSFITFIEHNKDIELIQDNAQKELEFYKSLAARVSLTDSTLVLLSQNLNADLITFDKQLERLSRRTNI